MTYFSTQSATVINNIILVLNFAGVCQQLASLFQETGMKVQRCSVLADPAYLYLTDGLLEDGLVEVKCSYTGRYEYIAQEPHFPLIEMKNNDLTPKVTHNYYEQVQQQLYLAKREKNVSL